MRPLGVRYGECTDDVVGLPPLQRPYMTIGTLRDQVIYPDSVTDLKRKGLGDDFIRQIIEKVNSM